MLYLTSFAADPATPISIKSTMPNNGEYLSHISTIRLDFDITDVLDLYPNIPESDFGLMNSSKTINVYKGLDSTGEIVGSTKIAGVVNTSAAFSPGKLYTEINFDTDIYLESDQVYCIVIPSKTYSVATTTTKYTNTVNLDPINIIVYGSCNSVTELLLIGSNPVNEANIEVLTEYELEFNTNVFVSDDAYMTLREGEEIIATTPISVSSVSQNRIIADFGNEVLYNTHVYTITVPINTIFSENDANISYKEIVLTLHGTALRYFNYGRISPSNNSEVDYLSRITVPIKLESGIEYIGRDFNPTVRMYKVEGDERTLMTDAIDCVMTEAANGFYINVFDFALEGSSTYQIEVEKDSFHLWSTETQHPLYDTSNEALTLTYTTPAEITPLAVQDFGAVTPTATEPVEKLESFKVMLAPYEFENTFYYPMFLSLSAENYNVVSVVDAADNTEVATFKVDIKWDTDNNYWLENIDPLDVTLLEGHRYEVRVPAGMVCCRYEPIRELTANKAFAVTYNGGYSPNCEFTYSVNGLSDMTVSVSKGSTVTVNVTPADNFKAESVTFNGEDVELSDDSFTTPALDSDEALLEVTFAYDGTVLFDFSTGVDDIADCPFKVWNDEDHIVIENVTVGADIKVYSVAGVLIADTTATDEVVNISVLPGVYVVVIDGVGLKVKH